MNKPKISVIVPIYNVGEYLEETLDCLVNQTLIDDMEVLMIDDGSSDESRYIIEKYALDYDNFFAYHKENEGASFSRNWGIDLAKGEYVNFFDADDYLLDDFYERLFRIAEDNDSDITTAPIVRYRRYNVFSGYFYNNCFRNIDRNIPSTKFERVPELIWDLFITNKLYKREFLNKNHLRFIEERRAYCDDTPFSLKAYLLADKISVYNDAYYYWRFRENETRSVTQDITNTQNFMDRLYAVKLYGETFKEFEISEEFRQAFYLKILNYDLHVHFSKFHLYDRKSYPEIIDGANEILSVIPQNSKLKLSPVKRIIYMMVEDRDIDALCEFTKLNLKENPHVPEFLNPKYAEIIDFNEDAKFEELNVKREEISLSEGNLSIQFSEKINYLTKDYPHRSTATLIDDENNEYPLAIEDDRILLPTDLIRDKEHMRIRMEYLADGLRKESYLKNSAREIFELDGFDVEISIKTDRQLCIDIRPTSDLTIEIDDISFKDNIFEFSAASSEKVDSAYIQNVVTFERFTYPVKSISENGKYRLSFSIPYEDILSYPVRKWELKVENTFKKIRLSRKFEFYLRYNMIYFMNARNKILVSDDIYNSLYKLSRHFEMINELRQSRREVRKANVQLKKANRKLEKENKKIKKENRKLNERNLELENTVVNISPIKNKLFKRK